MSIWTCGQEPASQDCGFFCAWVLRKIDMFGDFMSINLSREEVYTARERFFHGKENTHKHSIGPSALWMNEDNAIDFFRFVGLSNYSLFRGGCVADVSAALKASPGRGAMVAENGHWRAYLGQRDGCYWMYDPGANASPHLQRYQFYSPGFVRCMMLPS